MNDKEIAFSQSIKAGKRIYYLDVKKNRKDEMFLAITESKKIVMGEGDDSQVSFEKHKIFLYKEDFEKFMNGLQQAIVFFHQHFSCHLSIHPALLSILATHLQICRHPLFKQCNINLFPILKTVSFEHSTHFD